MKYLALLLLLCSCASYSHRQQETALKNVIKDNKEGAITDSLYELHKHHKQLK